MSKTSVLTAALLLAAAATPAAAEEFRGFYFGVHAGEWTQSDDPIEYIEADTDGDGEYLDTINSPTNPSFFRLFCGGHANDGYLEAGCRNDMDDHASDKGVRIGYDWQTLDLVYGLVAEHASGGVHDNVSAFASDQTTYTFDRELGDISSLRARVGFTFGDGTTVIYGLLGYAWSTVEHTFSTTNTTNTFVAQTDDEMDARGMQLGVGVETFVWKNFTMGLEWISTDLSHDPFVVRAGPGPTTPPTDPFVVDDPDGTDLRRTNNDIEMSSVRMTFNARFPGW